MANRKPEYLIAWIWTLLLSAICLIPPSLIPPINFQNFIGLDKLAHFILFLILTLLWLMAWSKYNELNHKVRIITFILCTGYGIAIEFMQQSVWINRNFEWFDVLADSLGVLLAILVLSKALYLTSFTKKHLPFINHLY